MMLADVTRRLHRLILRRIGKGPVDHATSDHQRVRVRGEYTEEQDAARLQDYGFASDPPADAEYLAVQVGGDPERLAALCIGAKDRPRDLLPGETRVYNQRGSRVQLLADGTLLVTNLLGEVRINPDGSILLTPLPGGPTSVLVSALGVTISTPLGIATFTGLLASIQAGASSLVLTPAGIQTTAPSETAAIPVVTQTTQALAYLGLATAIGCPTPVEDTGFANKLYVDQLLAAGLTGLGPTVSESPPSNPDPDDLWIRASDKTQFCYDDAAAHWVECGAGDTLSFGNPGTASGNEFGKISNDVVSNNDTKALKLDHDIVILHALARSKVAPTSGEYVELKDDATAVLTLTWTGGLEVEDTDPGIVIAAGSEIASQVIDNLGAQRPQDWQLILRVKEVVVDT